MEGIRYPNYSSELFKGNSNMEKIEGFLIVNGERIYDTEEKIGILNPATEEEIGKIPIADRELTEKSIIAAQKSFLGWSNKSLKERSEILHRAAKKVRERKEEISKTLTIEQGKPLREARSEVSVSAEILDYYAEEVKRIKGINYWNLADERDLKSQVIYQPIGIIAAMTPFNYPVSLTAFKVAPALAAGNTVIVKPSSITPLSVNLFIDCFLESGLPRGTLNFIAGSGERIIKWLIEDPSIKKISFTGSTDTGRKIMSMAGNYLKKLTLELGGNSPIIVFEDADMDKAVNDCVYRSFRNMGQICNSINRIYVQKKIYKSFIDFFIENTKKLVIGDGLENPDADLGPMASKEGVKKTEEHIKDAIRRGAQLKYGGKVPKKFNKGYFFEPTVITNVNHKMKIMCEETFGPVAPIMEFNNVEDAISLANDSPYGLVSYIYTKDLSKGIYVSEKLEYGTVNINNIAGAVIGYPYGGWKQSGIGIEVSEHALYEYLYLKHIRIKI